MAPPRPPRRPTRPAGPGRTRSCSRPSPQPRRWGRLLVGGLTLALVATLGTRALADDPDNGLSLVDSSGEQTDQATQPPTGQAPDQRAADQGDPSGDDTASVTPLGLVQPPTVLGQAHAEDTDGQALVAGRPPTGQSEQDEQPSGLAGGCVDGLCSQQPPGPGDPTVQAAAEGGGFLGPLWRAWSRWRGQQQPQRPPALETPSPSPETPLVSCV